MNKNTSRPGAWLNVLALFLSLLCVILSAGVALGIYFSQASIPNSTIWPMPGLMLAYWILLGIASFMVIGVSSFSLSAGWLQAAWGITGAFVPMIIFGALSIGTLVLVAFSLSLISTLLLTVRIRTKWLRNFGFFGLGVICSLLLLLIMIGLQNVYI